MDIHARLALLNYLYLPDPIADADECREIEARIAQAERDSRRATVGTLALVAELFNPNQQNGCGGQRSRPRCVAGENQSRAES